MKREAQEALKKKEGVICRWRKYWKPHFCPAAATGNKVLNITTPGGRVIATTTKASNVVTVNPKTLHLTAVKSAAGGTTGELEILWLNELNACMLGTDSK